MQHLPPRIRVFFFMRPSTQHHCCTLRLLCSPTQHGQMLGLSRIARRPAVALGESGVEEKCALAMQHGSAVSMHTLNRISAKVHLAGIERGRGFKPYLAKGTSSLVTHRLCKLA